MINGKIKFNYCHISACGESSSILMHWMLNH